jgi:hypothetical protein
MKQRQPFAKKHKFIVLVGTVFAISLYVHLTRDGEMAPQS